VREAVLDEPRMSLLPAFELPRITYRPRLTQRASADADALLTIVPEKAEDKLFAELAESERWRRLYAQPKPSTGSVRSSALGVAGATRAALGILRADATVFETLALAGRMLKEVAPSTPRHIVLAAPGQAGSGVALEALLSAALAQSFALPAFRTEAKARRIQQIDLIGTPRLDLKHVGASARGNNLARWLTALPPNMLDARGYRRSIGELARRAGLSLRWLDEATLKRLGANAFLAVAAGNAERTAGIAHLRYRPRRRRGAAPDIALIGKGILFDTGGTNLKPHRAMLDMHTDMSGSAVALATLIALAELDAPVAADAWLAITENRTGPSAYRPQDVVRAANGVTIQVIHTDAEGRMVLADTLALAGRTRPRLMLDFATLTGTCVYALTERMSGVFTNEPRLARKLVAAGATSGERVWDFPFDADYDSDLESKVADIMQCAPEAKGDHILAARFLSRFVPARTPWVHVDLSAAVRSGGLGHINTDVTGFGVRYALELILRQNVLGELERRD
jgi:leucyl aminopeptidase